MNTFLKPLLFGGILGYGLSFISDINNEDKNHKEYFKNAIIVIVILLSYQFINSENKVTDVINNVKNQVIDTGLPNF